jgi:UDP-N-acetylmuramoyl-L-alanyl-D-glutamate--2,6-diaminopimelate ligase
LTQDHLDFHHDMESYFASKLRLFTDGFAAHSCVVIDDEWGQRIAAASDSPVTTVSAQGPAQWSLLDAVTQSLHGQHFAVSGPSGEPFKVDLRLPGTFNVSNALLALAITDALRLPVEFASRGLADVQVPGRMERVAVANAPLGIVDYAHTPDAVARAVEATAGASAPLVVVLGAGGDRDADKRPAMGQAAAERADVVVITDDNPRSEDPADIRGSVASGASRGSAQVVDVAGRREAIRYAVSIAGRPGVVLVLGKGHETGQEIAGVMHPFDDRQELLAALTEFAAEDR